VWYLYGNGRRRGEIGLRLLSSQGEVPRRMSSFVWRDQTQFGQDESPRNTRFKKYILLLYHGHACDLRAHLTSRSFCSRRLHNVGVLTKDSRPIRMIIASLSTAIGCATASSGWQANHARRVGWLSGGRGVLQVDRKHDRLSGPCLRPAIRG